jgi:hypothetical protein
VEDILSNQLLASIVLADAAVGPRRLAAHLVLVEEPGTSIALLPS